MRGSLAAATPSPTATRADPPDRLTDEIDRLARGVRALRLVYCLIHRRDTDMARLLEIKGLGAAVSGIKSEISAIKTIAADINTEAPQLRAELADLRDQIKQHRADLRFEAEALGNGGGSETEEAAGSESSSTSFHSTGGAGGT